VTSDTITKFLLPIYPCVL